MSHRAWAYLGSILTAGLVLGGLALRSFSPDNSQWTAFVTLTLLAALVQLFKVEAPNHQFYSLTPVFLFAGIILLPPSLFVLLIVISHFAGWVKERVTGSLLLRDWYAQPFNAATHIIAASIAHDVLVNLNASPGSFEVWSTLFAIIIAAFIYDIVNHLAVGLAVSLLRNVPLRESGILEPANLLLDGVLLLIGATLAVLWLLNPFLILLPLSPLVLIQQALKVPQLKKEASTDEKTGLWNARHFTKLFTAEIERAKRFHHSLAFVMADLDLLRNINNTYGHLAGDAVLAGVGRIIRSNLREYDIAGRFGGEEFSIALPVTDLANARLIAERIRETVQSTRFQVPTNPSPIRATLSLGVACFTQDALTPAELIHEADIAVYQAKLKGRNQVVCASEVPLSIRFESTLPEDRLASSFTGFIARPSAVARAVNASATPSPPGTSATLKWPRVEARRVNYPETWPALFVGAVITAAVFAALAGLLARPAVDIVELSLFVLLAVVAELYQVSVGPSTISVSTAIFFAAALVTDLPGVIFVSLAIGLTELAQRRLSWDQLAFDWSSRFLAGLPPIIVLRFMGVPLEAANPALLLLPMAIAALAGHLIYTGLMSISTALSAKVDVVATWRNEFGWLTPHYVALGIMGLFLAAAHDVLGPLGELGLVIPIMLIRYTQKQYVEWTQGSIEELRRVNLELGLANHEMNAVNATYQTLNDGLFLTLAKIIDDRDPYVSGHSAQVSEYATAIATEMGLAPQRIRQVRHAALLHDIGKLEISEAVLHKAGRLTPEEYEEVKSHARRGAAVVDKFASLRHLAPFVAHHHEWWNGQGYPDGLQEDQIPLEARILAVSDAVEAMASDRPYRHGMWPREIMEEIWRCSGTQFDPQIAHLMIQILEREGQQLVTNLGREVAPRPAAAASAEQALSTEAA